MQTIKAALEGAVGERIISADQAQALAVYMERQGVDVTVPPEPAAGFVPPVGAAAEAAFAPVEDTEAPRFIRGFHDVLITIGVCIAMAGLWGLGSLYAVLPAVIILAEVLVRRQRLALPAVALTLILTHWIFMAGTVLFDDAFGTGDAEPMLRFVLTMLPFALLLGPFYLRYRIPLALSLWIVSLAAIVLGLLFLALGRISGSDDFIVVHSTVSAAIFLAGALALFAVAMRYDLSDRFRVTRRSDIAFWLHLAVAPALLYALLAFVFLGDFYNSSLFSANRSLANAVVIVAVVVVVMLIGIIIDRRAFVTSGLVSLGVAVASLIQRTQTAPELFVFVALFIVGVVVLTIGVGWPHFRRVAVGALPQALRDRLPPVR